MKFCGKCREAKSTDEFYLLGNGSPMSICKTCHKAAVSSRAHRYKETRAKDYKNRKRWHVLKNKYGITKQRYESMLSDQGGVCAICKCSPEFSSKKVLHVDHDHLTGSIRGLLCHSCNIALGAVSDNPERLFQLAAYVTPKVAFQTRLAG